MRVTSSKLHPQGPEVSEIVWGQWRVLKSEETDTPEKLARRIELCLELGISTFDNADIYGGYAAEALFGAALKAWGGGRDAIRIVTKCGVRLVHPARPDHRVKHYDAGACHIRDSVEGSLRALGTDYIDVLLLHRPDPLMDADETARALEELIRAGKVRHVGVSNHLPHQIDLLQSRLSVPLVTNQVEFSVMTTEPLSDRTFDQAQRMRFRPMAWSPLGGGSLFRDQSERGERVARALQAVADEIGIPDSTVVALAWVMRHPSRPVPVLGTGRAERLRAAVRASELHLDRQHWFRILEASTGHPVP